MIIKPIIKNEIVSSHIKVNPHKNWDRILWCKKKVYCSISMQNIKTCAFVFAQSMHKMMLHEKIFIKRYRHKNKIFCNRNHMGWDVECSCKNSAKNDYKKIIDFSFYILRKNVKNETTRPMTNNRLRIIRLIYLIKLVYFYNLFVTFVSPMAFVLLKCDLYKNYTRINLIKQMFAHDWNVINTCLSDSIYCLLLSNYVASHRECETMSRIVSVFNICSRNDRFFSRILSIFCL